MTMEKEFFAELKKKCEQHKIDIDILCEEEIQLIYNGITFDLQWYEFNDKLEVPLSIVNMSIKGKDYNWETYSFVDIDYSDSYDTVEQAIEEVIDIVLNCDERRKAMKVINSFESFVDGMSEDDMSILLSYVKNNYD
jgi:hypothetical protein